MEKSLLFGIKHGNLKAVGLLHGAARLRHGGGDEGEGGGGGVQAKVGKRRLDANQLPVERAKLGRYPRGSSSEAGQVYTPGIPFVWCTY